MQLVLILLLKILESFSDFALQLNLNLYLSKEFGYDDSSAARLIAAWTVVVGLICMTSGPVFDRLGVQTSLRIGFFFSVFGRALFAWARTEFWMLVSLFLIQPFGLAFGVSVLRIGVRRVTEPADQPQAYGAFYTAMNVAAIASGLATDYLKDLRLLFAWCVVTTCAYGIVVACVDIPDAPKAAQVTSIVDEVKSTVTSPIYPTLLLLSVALIGSRSVLRHTDQTIPKYMLRRLGPDAPYGTVNAINPVLVVLLTTFLQKKLAPLDAYLVIWCGTVLLALAPFVLAVQHASLSGIVTFIAISSLGEIVETPRLDQFSMAVAPEGKEGIFGAIVNVPLFGARYFATVFAGDLLQEYCHAPPFRCQLMWLKIGLFALTTPVTLALGKRWLYNRHVRERVRPVAHDSV